jgi:hypothetical protein
MDMGRRLSTLWIVVMFNMVFADILAIKHDFKNHGAPSAGPSHLARSKTVYLASY